MNGTSGFHAGCGKTISAQQRFDGLHVWDKRRTPSQDAQKGRPARPQQAKWRCVLCSVRGASERSENAAGGLFQHPARSAVFYLPITITYRFLHEQQHQFGTSFWHDFHALYSICTTTLPLGESSSQETRFRWTVRNGSSGDSKTR